MLVSCSSSVKELPLISLGLMSGTSMDGIDAAMLRTNGDCYIEELGSHSLRYTSETKVLLKSAEYAIRECKGDMIKAALNYTKFLDLYLRSELKIHSTQIASKMEALAFDLYSSSGQPMTLDGIIQHSTWLHGQLVMDFLKIARKDRNEIDVVGYHGQTMYHQPNNRVSIIIGNGQALADQIGIKVVNDFRACDIAAGGKGAPLAPLYHLALSKRDRKIPLAIVNCGGISNITIIPDDNPLHLIGFDAGPGNGLIDRLVGQRTFGQESMDKDGRYGEKGVVNEVAFKALCDRSIIKDGVNYLLMPPPKALDIGDFVLVSELDSLSLEDACRTLEAFTAHVIVSSINLSQLPSHWVLVGGGWKNPVIVSELKNRLSFLGIDQRNIRIADEIQWNNDAVEAQIFAYFAVRSLYGYPLSYPGTTGVAKPITGGKIHIPCSGGK